MYIPVYIYPPWAVVVAAAVQRLQSRSAVDGDRRGRSHVRIGRGVGSEPVKVPSQLVELELLGDGSIDPVHVSRSRHIERRYLKTLEWVSEGKIVVKYKNTKENRADMFTKALDQATFEEPAGSIMGWAHRLLPVAHG